MFKATLKTAIAAAAIATLAGCIIIDADQPSIDARVERSCQAERYQSLVGKEASSIKRESLPSAFRMVCAGCPMTMDFRQDRLTIQLDQANRVESARCG